MWGSFLPVYICSYTLVFASILFATLSSVFGEISFKTNYDQEEKAFRSFNPNITSKNILNEIKFFHSQTYSTSDIKSSPLFEANHQKDIFILEDNIIEDYEKWYIKQRISNLWNAENGIETNKYSFTHDYFGILNNIWYDNSYPWHSLVPDHAKIQEFSKSKVKDLIKVEPPSISLTQEICIPETIPMVIRNPSNQNWTIVSIKSDIYNVKIFYNMQIPDNKAKTIWPQISNYWPLTIPKTNWWSLKLIIWWDREELLRGTIYIEFNNKQVLLIPLEFFGVPNQYRVSPLYYTIQDWKQHSFPVTLYNPLSKVLLIKQVVHSLNSINWVWPNDLPIHENSTSNWVTTMFEIQPKETKNVMYIKFHKETDFVECGIIQINTEKSNLIIPVVIKVERKAIQVFPSVLNFGVFEWGNNLKLGIPWDITNISDEPIEIKKIYLNYKENMWEIVPSALFELKKTKNSNAKSNNNNYIDKTSDNPSNVILSGEHLVYAYVFIRKSTHINSDKIHKFTRNEIVIETNYTSNPILKLNYTYFLDDNKYVITTWDNPEKKIKQTQFNIYYDIQINLVRPFSFIQRNDIPLGDNYTFYRGDNCSGIIQNPWSYDSSVIGNIQLIILERNNGKNYKNYYFPLKLNFNAFIILELTVNDVYWDMWLCSHKENINGDCMKDSGNKWFRGFNKNKNTNIIWDFNSIGYNQTKQTYAYIINSGTELIDIFDVDTDNNDLTFNIEGYTDIYLLKEVEVVHSDRNWNDKNWLMNEMKRKQDNKEKNNIANKTSKKISIPVYPNTALIWSINLQTQNENKIGGAWYMMIQNGKKEMSTTKFLISATVHKGSLNISPSTIRFEPAFPGWYQTKMISSKSSYNQPIRISKAISRDTRIDIGFLSYDIPPNNRTEILQLKFSPKNDKHIIEPNWIMSLDNNNNNNNNHFRRKYLTNKEWYLWKLQQRNWEILGSEGKTEINHNLTIITPVQTEEINIRAFLTKPSLVKKDQMDFGWVQIGESVNYYIEGFNPSDEVLHFQLLLADEKFYNVQDMSMFNDIDKYHFTNNHNIIISNCLIKDEGKDGSSFENHEFIIDDININITGINRHTANKNDISKQIFTNVPKESKAKLMNNSNVFCSFQEIDIFNILQTNNKELISKLFSKDFDNDINTVKIMTQRQAKFMHEEDRNSGESNTILAYLIDLIKSVFNWKTSVGSSNYQMESTLNEIREKMFDDEMRLKQEFYLPNSLTNKSYYIKPHQKFKIGPIIYHPSSFNLSVATWWIKNNLTILYPIKIKGKGGSGVLSFANSNTKKKRTSNNNSMLINNTTMVINIDHKTYSKEIGNNNYKVFQYKGITRSITWSNTGTMSLKIKSINIENQGCEAYGIKILQCNKFDLLPNENIDIDIQIVPNFNLYLIEKDIFFVSNKETIKLKIIVKNDKELLFKHNLLFNYRYWKTYMIIGFLIGVLVLFIALNKVAYLWTGKREKIDSKRGRLVIINANTKFCNGNYSEPQYIKLFRKSNINIWDDFIKKQIDKPGSSVDMDTITNTGSWTVWDKKKSKKGKQKIMSALKRNEEIHSKPQVETSKKQEKEEEEAEEHLINKKESSKTIVEEKEVQPENAKPVEQKGAVNTKRESRSEWAQGKKKYKNRKLQKKNKPIGMAVDDPSHSLNHDITETNNKDSYYQHWNPNQMYNYWNHPGIDQRMGYNTYYNPRGYWPSYYQYNQPETVSYHQSQQLNDNQKYTYHKPPNKSNIPSHQSQTVKPPTVRKESNALSSKTSESELNNNTKPDSHIIQTSLQPNIPRSDNEARTTLTKIEEINLLDNVDTNKNLTPIHDDIPRNGTFFQFLSLHNEQYDDLNENKKNDKSVNDANKEEIDEVNNTFNIIDNLNFENPFTNSMNEVTDEDISTNKPYFKQLLDINLGCQAYISNPFDTEGKTSARLGALLDDDPEDIMDDENNEHNDIERENDEEGVNEGEENEGSQVYKSTKINFNYKLI